jgi:hypothetical protein
MKYTLLFITAIALFSCKQKPTKQSVKDKQTELENGSLDSANLYSVKEIGWTAKIPPNWEILTREAVQKNTERGKKEIEKTFNGELDASQLKQLLNLKKDRFNSFLSTMEPYDGKEGGSYNEHNRNIYDVMKQAYEANGIYATYKEDSTEIDGLKFYVFIDELYNTDKKTVILRQVMYSRLINGFDFGMTISYNDEESMEQLKKMVFSSKFSIR